MIIELRTKNCFSFEDQIVFSMKADMRNKKFASNVHRENNFNIFKDCQGFMDLIMQEKHALIKCFRCN